MLMIGRAHRSEGVPPDAAVPEAGSPALTGLAPFGLTEPHK